MSDAEFPDNATFPAPDGAVAWESRSPPLTAAAHTSFHEVGHRGVLFDSAGQTDGTDVEHVIRCVRSIACYTLAVDSLDVGERVLARVLR